ncbi:hypothetical protein GN958_ATG11794 [Phytophthora infestans]|uniref:Uncharacterized protein n=1 Tax=Phytophthora infestans TaxID=4787 RepID=A0A8S9UEJ7_PHYIN|nr:hypothetical protein GN958_ATG11794 [Phytophthora infestans]
MADANMEHHGGGVQPEHSMAAFERIAAGLSQQNAQIYCRNVLLCEHSAAHGLHITRHQVVRPQVQR